MKPAFVAALLAAVAIPAVAAEPAKPLFASDAVVNLVIKAPVDDLARGGPDSNSTAAGTMSVAGSADSVPVTLNLRGITRRERDVCQFPPLRVRMSGAAPAGSLFAGQRSLKLVTHCRPGEAFQQYVLLEYAAYRLYNELTPLSFRARLARIDYQRPDGRSIATRYGFFIEDADDVARRNGMREAEVGERIPVSRLQSGDAARYALFEYMISNLDWAMQAGPAGDNCCHNARLLGVNGGASPTLVPVPYDFDFSGFVDAPYAVPPNGISVSGVKQRRYRGFCRDNAAAKAMLPTFRAQKPVAERVLASIPDLRGSVRSKAIGFLGGFFNDIASDNSADAKLFKTCLG